MTVSIEQAQLKLAELICAMRTGETIDIEQGGNVVAELTIKALGRRPEPGALKGKVHFIADDDSHLDDFQEYM